MCVEAPPGSVQESVSRSCLVNASGAVIRLVYLASSSAANLLAAKRRHGGARVTGYPSPIGKHAIEGRK
ncbi:hypothetical protein Bcep1808_6421 [Burkholderia vietnamiensis G4]|uniref:Uncharacterized protein n=1 Tax=Burkholderia vietnamiensis (strain G4 / LMG 22486) TaxID=269482 RepID=A4JSR5_BURVG|nr:hypothetical protein Bcep1808_6421 [Burkholderia vietnamiensis G4]